MPGAGLTSGTCAKALSDRPAFQPYWGKPTVRNDRGDGGNVGIIRSPLRATVLPDHRSPSPGSRVDGEDSLHEFQTLLHAVETKAALLLGRFDVKARAGIADRELNLL